VVDKHAITTIGQVERNVLVGLLARGATVFVPQVNNLAVLHERGETLSKPVDILAHAQVELLMDVAFSGCRIDQAHAPPAAAGEHLAVREKVDPPGRPLVHTNRQVPTGQRRRVCAVTDRYLWSSLLV